MTDALSNTQNSTETDTDGLSPEIWKKFDEIKEQVLAIETTPIDWIKASRYITQLYRNINYAGTDQYPLDPVILKFESPYELCFGAAFYKIYEEDRLPKKTDAELAAMTLAAKEKYKEIFGEEPDTSSLEDHAHKKAWMTRIYGRNYDPSKELVKNVLGTVKIIDLKDIGPGVAIAKYEGETDITITDADFMQLQYSAIDCPIVKFYTAQRRAARTKPVSSITLTIGKTFQLDNSSKVFKVGQEVTIYRRS